MKIFIFLLVSLISWCATSSELMPLEHYVCTSFQNTHDVNMTCIEGRQFYSDQDGRCGCLDPQEVITKEECRVQLLSCSEEQGFTYSTLYQDLNRCGFTRDVVVGCGCFKTAQ